MHVFFLPQRKQNAFAAVRLICSIRIAIAFYDLTTNDFITSGSYLTEFSPKFSTNNSHHKHVYGEFQMKILLILSATSHKVNNKAQHKINVYIFFLFRFWAQEHFAYMHSTPQWLTRNAKNVCDVNLRWYSQCLLQAFSHWNLYVHRSEEQEFERKKLKRPKKP